MASVCCHGVDNAVMRRCDDARAMCAMGGEQDLQAEDEVRSGFARRRAKPTRKQHQICGRARVYIHTRQALSRSHVTNVILAAEGEVLWVFRTRKGCRQLHQCYGRFTDAHITANSLSPPNVFHRVSPPAAQVTHHPLSPTPAPRSPSNR